MRNTASIFDCATESRHMQPIIAALIKPQPATDCAARLVSSTVVRHKPGRRCIVRYDLDANGGDSSVVRHTLLGKIRARGLDRRTYKLTRHLWRNGFGADSTDGVQVPEPVGAIPELKMWLQRYIHAATLGDQLDSPDAEIFCNRTGAALHKLHATGPRPRRQHGMVDEIRILNNALSEVKRDLPCLAPRIRQIQLSCERLAGTIDDYIPTPIHRDFYSNQILINKRGVWLLDLDLYTLGDPAVDTGNFVAHLQETSLRRFGHCHGYANLERAFLRGYRDKSGQELSFSVQTYVTLALARHIAISRRIPSRRKYTQAVINVCERRLWLNPVGAESRVEGGDHAPSDRPLVW